MAPRISIDQLVAWTPSKIQSGFVDGQGLIVDHTPDSWTYVGELYLNLKLVVEEQVGPHRCPNPLRQNHAGRKSLDVCSMH